MLPGLLIPGMLFSQDMYSSWFTDVQTDEFTAYYPFYTITQLPRPTGFPMSLESTGDGTRGSLLMKGITAGLCRGIDDFHRVFREFRNSRRYYGFYD